jgi:hypothetical protein
MKMVFFSPDKPEVQRLAKELADAGIPCKVRKEVIVEDAPVHLPEAELWIENDDDCHRAFLLCVERNAGFARRELKGFSFESVSENLAA